MNGYDNIEKKMDLVSVLKKLNNNYKINLHISLATWINKVILEENKAYSSVCYTLNNQG